MHWGLALPLGNNRHEGESCEKKISVVRNERHDRSEIDSLMNEEIMEGWQEEEGERTRHGTEKRTLDTRLALSIDDARPIRTYRQTVAPKSATLMIVQ